MIFSLPGAGHFFRGVGDVPRRKKLALLDVDHAAGAPGGDEQVGLARKKRRNLEDVADLGGRSDVRDLVNVGQDRQAGALLDVRQDAKALRQARAAVGRHRRAVGLVVGRLEDQRHAELGRSGGKELGHHGRVRLAFDHARSRDQDQRRAPADGDLADFEAARWVHS